MMLGAGPIADGPISGTPLQAATDAVVSSPLLSPDAKMAIKDFLKESYEEIWHTLDDLLSIDIPQELMQWWDVVAEIIKNLIT